MADDRNIGVGAALTSLSGAAAGTPEAEPENAQDALFDLDGPDEDGGAIGTLIARERTGKPGRPKGSPNKRTEDLRRFILARYKHPVVALMDIGTIATEQLAAWLDCDPLDAIKLQARCLAEAAPYVDSKMPQRIQITDKDRLPSFGLEFAAGTMNVVDPAGNRISMTTLAARAKVAFNQRLSDGEANGSNLEGSNDVSQAHDPLAYSGE